MRLLVDTMNIEHVFPDDCDDIPKKKSDMKLYDDIASLTSFFNNNQFSKHNGGKDELKLHNQSSFTPVRVAKNTEPHVNTS